METRDFLGILGGFVIGLIFALLRAKDGLTKREWLYLMAFRDALRKGTYEDNMDEKEGEIIMTENGIDWAAKLTSRKLWMAISGLVSGIMLAMRFDEQTVTQVTGIIMAGASVLAYIFGEAWADAAGAKAAGTIEDEPEGKPPEGKAKEDPMEDDLK